jgi:YkoY family integral membrane protein
MAPDITAGLTTVLSLVIIEGLLSVDNVLGIATLAKELPEHEQKRAIRLGMIGAYVFRIIALILAGWLISHTWIRWLGAGYLVFLMCSHLTQHDGEEGQGKSGIALATFGAILFQIAIMDLSLSIDNVITAVTLAPKGPDGKPLMWPIYTGVTISIFALQLLAPLAIRMLDRYPILGPTAFVLLGFVGGILMAEEIWPAQRDALGAMIPHTGFHLHPLAKFACIFIIIAVAMIYARGGWVQRLLSPVFRLMHYPMRAIAALVKGTFYPLKLIAGLLKRAPKPA